MCMQCLQGQVDITEGVTKQITMPFCRNCERFLNPPNQWIVCAPESKELLSLCLKRIKGLNKVRLIDAGFIWTEPHSRRLKVKLTIQKEVMGTAILQQAFVVEAVLANQHCEDCDKVMAQNTWKAVVQVRQKVNHKRTFLYLEQIILKYGMHKDATNIKDLRDGLDFFFGSKNQAVRLLEFLASVVPIRYKTSEQLISSDIHSGTANYKFTYSVELVPICKDDLVCLPSRVSSSILGGSVSPLVLCTKVTNLIQFLDPNTLQMGEIGTNEYWRHSFRSLCTTQDLVEYYVLDIENHNNYGSSSTSSSKKVQPIYLFVSLCIFV